MRHLVDLARENGITELVAEVLPGNTPMLRLLHEAGETEAHFQSGEIEVRVHL